MAEPRLVIASNRVPPPSTGTARSVGGLVSALQPALEERGGLWFGWSGATAEASAPRRRIEGHVEYVTIDLDTHEVEAYYEGFCNRALWPLLHGLADRAQIDADEYRSWIEVTGRFADALASELTSGDLVWVHDYHLIALGRALRQRGWAGKLGYFHHVPVPLEAAWRQIPEVDAIAASFEAYDLIGVQTQRDAARLVSYVSAGVRDRIRAFPIGIDPERVRALARAHPADPFEVRGRRQVLLGLDRLDYSKGIPDRLLAFEELLRRTPRIAAEALLVQWAAPSRESITDYQLERQRVEAAVERLDALATPSPVAFDFSVLPAEVVAAALRDADVCLVTSLADGMNLVAKEFVAAQREEDPGVLVLTDGCGAAEELTEALIVPSGDRAALSDAMGQALRLGVRERRERWEALSRKVERGNVEVWCARFLEALEATSARTAS